RYLVWVGTMQTPDPRKRIAALTRATRSMPLVLVGPTAQWAHELRGVKLTGAVSDDELAAIYTGAHALVFPSDDHGFRLPPADPRSPGAACRHPGRPRTAARCFARSPTSTASWPQPSRPCAPRPRRRPGRGTTRPERRGRFTARRSTRPAPARSRGRNIGPQ